jgi:hypothetical protein
MSKELLALIVNPGSNDPVRSIGIDGYEGIRKRFGAGAQLEGSTLCHFQGNIYLQIWVDCEQYMLAPAWVSSLNHQVPIHGLAVIDAYDISTGEQVDCPIDSEALLATIEWEPVEDRLDPERPRPEWIERFQIEDSQADVVIQYGE